MRDIQIQDMEANKSLFGQQFLETQTREKNIKELISQKQHELGSLQTSLYQQEALIHQAQVRLNSGDEVIAARATVDEYQTSVANLNAQITQKYGALLQNQNTLEATQEELKNVEDDQGETQNKESQVRWKIDYHWIEQVPIKIASTICCCFKIYKVENFPHFRHRTPEYEKTVHPLLDEQIQKDIQYRKENAAKELELAQSQAEVLRSSISDTLKEIEANQAALKAIEKDALESIMQLGSLVKQNDLKHDKGLDMTEDVDNDLYAQIQSIVDTHQEQLTEAGKFLVFSHD